MVCRCVFVLLEKNEDSTSSVDVGIYLNIAVTLKSKPNWKTKKKMQAFSLCAREMQGVLLAYIYHRNFKGAANTLRFSETVMLPAE